MPYVTIYVQVEDLHATLAEVTVFGGSTLVPPMAINDGVDFAMFRDIEGKVVG